MDRQAPISDLIIVGSGASGLATAVTAAWHGLDVIVIEKESVFGGTTAWSGGWLWIPRNSLAIKAGIVEDLELPLSYLRKELGEDFDEALAKKFLIQGPKMVSFFEKNTSLSFVDGNLIPDFHDMVPGAGHGGRSVCAKPINGRALGTRLRDLKPPLDLIAPFGMGIASGGDLKHFLNATRRVRSFIHVSRRILIHLYQKIRYGCGLHLVNGNALIARLLKSADDMGVKLIKNVRVKKLLADNQRIMGVETDSGPYYARCGVVLATGGFPHDAARIKQLFPHAPSGEEHYSAAPLSNTGDGLRLGESVGGIVRTDLPHAGAWAPVSRVPNGKGRYQNFPHLLERAKPGLIMVRNNGKRFGNEANSYHDLMQDLFSVTPPGEAVECWMICNHQFQRRYGLGRSRPRPFPLRHWLVNGYLQKGNSIAELAATCGIDADTLQETVRNYNHHALAGQDPEFGRGSSAYNRIQGDLEHKPNPCVAPIIKGPFYAVKIVAGSLGTFAGLETDHDMRVIDKDGQPIAGLFAVGNDRVSIMAGRYPAGGITLGPGMTSGYIAAHTASAVPLDNNRSE